MKYFPEDTHEVTLQSSTFSSLSRKAFIGYHSTLTHPMMGKGFVIALE